MSPLARRLKWITRTPPDFPVPARAQRILRQPPDELCKQRAVVRQPVQRGVGIDDVCCVFGLPVGEALLHPVHARQTVLRAREHFGGVVDASDLRIGPTCLQQACHIACAAAEINHVGGICRVNAREQIDGRTQSRLGELEVLLRIPSQVACSCICFDEM